MSSSSETGGPFSRFDPRRLLSSLCEFTRKMRRTSEDAPNSERSHESNLDDIIGDDEFDSSSPMPLDGGRDKRTPTCDLCSNKQRQQLSSSLQLTDGASSDKYYTAQLSPDDVETPPLETRDSIECLLETLQTQHGGKVPRWARRAARIVNQPDADDEERSSTGEEKGQKRPSPLQHETTVEVDEASPNARVVRKNGSKVASLLLLFEPLAR